MRKLRLFSAVLSLFLLVPASIIWAQITKTINGTVRYESGMSETKFSTPNGNIVVYLPQSLPGGVITGTVKAEPEGKNEKERNRNLKELQKLTINLPGKKILLPAAPENFEWLADIQKQIPGELILARISSGEVLAKAPLTPVIPAQAFPPSTAAPQLTTPSKLLVKGDALNLYTNQQFVPGEKFVITDAKGLQFTVRPVCMSANQAVLVIPAGAVSGEMTVTEELWNQPMIKFDLGRAKVNMIDINLTSPNTNLRSGQSSSVTITVNQGGGNTITGMEREIFLNLPAFKIDLRNLNPNTVTMEGGNLQRVPVNQFRQKLMEGEAARIEFQLERRITGNAAGSFSVSATLHEDHNTCNDPFRPQLNVLNTPGDFNAWAGALRKDLGHYATIFHGSGGDGGTAGILKQNIQRAIDNLPVCTGPEQLDASKAVAYALIQPLNIPQGAANTWLSGFEAFKSSIATFSGREELSRLFDMAIAANGLDIMERIAWRNNDQLMMQEITKARKDVGSANENTAAGMTSQLRSLSTHTEKKITAEMGRSIWKYADMLFSTYCFNKLTKDGIDPVADMIGYLDPDKKILKVKPEYQQQVLRSLNAVPAGGGYYLVSTISQTRRPVSHTIQLMPFVFAGIYNDDAWAEYLISKAFKDTARGDVIDTTRKSDGTWYIFYQNAKCVKWGYEESTTSCMKETEWDAKEQKFKETGRYEKVTIYPGGSCKKGTEFCTEMYVVTSSTQLFMDAGCTRRTTIEYRKNFSCL